MRHARDVTRVVVHVADEGAQVRLTVRDDGAGSSPGPSPSEEEVLLHVARGRTNSEIADDLHISISTAKTHLAGLMRKLGARNGVEIAMWAHDTGRVQA